MPDLVFKRLEKKFIIDQTQYEDILTTIKSKMEFDPFCVDGKAYRVQNIYFDSINNDLASLSIRRPVFKEKIRVRKYRDSEVIFLELKKKFDGLVGKRRLVISVQELNNLIEKHELPTRESFLDKEALGEIKRVMNLFKLEPRVYLSYDRLAFFDKNKPNFRIAFDNNLHSRREDFDFNNDSSTFSLLEEGKYIMEVKSVSNFPLWFVRELSKLKVYPRFFSKYGSEYELQLAKIKSKK